MVARPTAGLLALLLAVASLVLAAPPRATAQDDGPADTDRLAGGSRIDTAAAIARAAFPDGADEVFLARADVLADALAAGTLSSGPVLLVPACGAVPDVVTEAIADLDPRRVTALGGTAAVCDDLLAAAGEGRVVGRVAGGNRIETAIAIAAREHPAGARVVHLADAADSPDAVAGGGLTLGPILLVPGGGPLPEAVAREIARLDPAQVLALGGANAVADDVLAAAADGRRVGRLAGGDRFSTAAAIARHAYGPASVEDQTATTAYLARADVFADAVAAGALTDGPVLLVPSCGALPEPVAAELRRLAVDRVVALGGPAALCDDLLAAAAAERPAPPDLAAGVVELSETEMGAVVEAADDRLVFRGAAPDLAAGDLVVGPPAPQLPAGLLAEVVEVTSAGGDVVVATRPAAVEEVLGDGTVVDARDLTTDDLLAVEAVDGVVLQGAGAGFDQAPESCGGPSGPEISGGELSLENVVLYDADGDVSTTGDRIVASGSISVWPELDFVLDLSGASVETFRFVAGLEVGTEVAVEVGDSVKAEETLELATLTYGPFFVPGTPVPYVVEVPLELTVSAEAEVAITASASTTTVARAGIEWEDGWDTIGDLRTDIEHDVELTATFTVRAEASAGVELKFAGVVGPNVKAAAFIEAVGDAVGDPAWTLEAGWALTGGLEADLPGIGNALPRISATFFEARWPLATSQGPVVSPESQAVSLQPGALPPIGYEVVDVATPTTDGQDVRGIVRQVSMSDDGRWIGFTSNATNLAATPVAGAAPDGEDSSDFDPYLYDTATGELVLLPDPRPEGVTGGTIDRLLVTGSGSHVVYLATGTGTDEEGGTIAVPSVWRYPIGGGGVEHVSAELPPHTRVDDGELSASADGSVIVTNGFRSGFAEDRHDPYGLIVWQDGAAAILPALPSSEREIGGTCFAPNRYDPAVAGDGSRVAFTNTGFGGIDSATAMVAYDLPDGPHHVVGLGSAIDFATEPLAIADDGAAVAWPRTPLEGEGQFQTLLYVTDLDAGTERLLTVTEGGSPDGDSSVLHFADQAGALVLHTHAENLSGGVGRGLYAFDFARAGLAPLTAAQGHLDGSIATSSDLRQAAVVSLTNPTTGEVGEHLYVLRRTS